MNKIWRWFRGRPLFTAFVFNAIYFLVVALLGWSANPIPVLWGMCIAVWVVRELNRSGPLARKQSELMRLELVLEEDGPHAQFRYNRTLGISIDDVVSMSAQTLAAAQAVEHRRAAERN